MPAKPLHRLTTNHTGYQCGASGANLCDILGLILEMIVYKWYPLPEYCCQLTVKFAAAIVMSETPRHTCNDPANYFYENTDFPEPAAVC